MKLRLIQDEYTGDLLIQKGERLIGTGPESWRPIEKYDFPYLKEPFQYRFKQADKAEAIKIFDECSKALGSKTRVIMEFDPDYDPKKAEAIGRAYVPWPLG